MKTCKKCGEEKPLTDFRERLDKPRKDGTRKKYRVGRCRPCEQQADAPGIAQWRANNKEKVAAYQVEWTDKNRARRYEITSAWSKRNPEYVNTKASEYRARRRSAESTLTVDEWRLMVEVHEGRCAKCNKEEVSLDHVVPLSKGGSHTLENIQPLCVSCNSSKGNRHATDYRLQDWAVRIETLRTGVITI